MNRVLLSFFLSYTCLLPLTSQDPASGSEVPAIDTIRVTPGTELQDTVPVQRDARSQDTVPVQRGEVTEDMMHDDPDLRMGDTLLVEQPDFSHSPRKAIMYALVLPGLGQGYNEKYYKIPIVYVAFGVAGYAISFNSGKYREASLEYAQTRDELNERILRYWRRNLELSYIGLVAVYALQVLDAYVDAQLYSWDVNEDLSMRISPGIRPMMAAGRRPAPVYGLTCSFDLKRR